MPTIWPKFEDVKKQGPAQVKSGPLWPSFDKVIVKQPQGPVYNKAGFDVSKNVMNPLNPNNQINQEFPKVNVLKETFKPSNLWDATKEVLPGSVEQGKNIWSDVKNLKNVKMEDIKQAPGKFATAAWDTVKDAVGNEAINVIELVTGKEDQTGRRLNNSEIVSRGIKTITGGANVAFSPITAIFKGAEEVPGLDIIAQTISLPFTIAGDAGTGAAKEVVKKLPISQEAKDEISPAVEELFALAGQIILGKASAKVTPGLREKFGQKNAEVIVQKAVELAAEKKAGSAPKTAVQFPKENPLVEGKIKQEVPTLSKTKKAVEGEKAPSVVQIVNPKTGEKTFKTINAKEFKSVKQAIDGSKKGIAGKNIKDQIFHITAKTPEQMKAAGFKDGGTIKMSEIPKSKAQAIKTAEIKAGKPVTPKAKDLVPTAKTTSQGKPLRVRKIPIKEKMVDTPTIKTSRLAMKVEAKAIEAKLTQGFEGKPEYATVNMKKQAEAATRLIEKDPQKAMDVAMGRSLPPEGILPESVFTAVERRAHATGDIATLRDLATSSSLASEATGMGQRLRALAERDPDSAVGRIQEVLKAREDAALRRFGEKTITEAKKKVSKEIEKAIDKTNTPKTWSSFVESIKC